ncbi:MAG: GC-type dockerin domain-anchored protein [Planctomycetota bacterium]
MITLNITPKSAAIAALIAAVTATPALAQSTGFAWSENAGWINFDASNGDSQGPVYQTTAITGFAWAENFGWINLGSTATPPPRDMQTGEAFGIGIDDDGYLFGYAWAENAGWISFGPHPQVGTIATPLGDADASPRVRRGRLLGAAWAENLGWINLSLDNTLDPERAVQLICPADTNIDGVANFFDLSLFLTRFNAGSLRADWDDNGVLNFFDISGYLADFVAGCP